MKQDNSIACTETRNKQEEYKLRLELLPAQTKSMIHHCAFDFQMTL